MRDLFWLSDDQLARIEPFFPLAHGVPRVKTLYNRFKRWSEMGVFDNIFSHLAAEGGPPDTLMIDASHLKAHRTASSLLKKGMFPAISGARKAG